MTNRAISMVSIFVLTTISFTARGGSVAGSDTSDGTPPTQTIIQPFNIAIAPMERLLLINFEEDPDSVYIGFEPQVFDDTVHGRGHLVIGWRRDGYVDVYHQATLSPDPETYDITGKGLNRMISAEFAMAAFEVTATGAQAFYRFTDIHGREILMKVAESNTRKRKPFGLLAPMGSAAEAPSSMPLILLHDFYFVRVKNTVITISIDGKLHIPDRLALPIDFKKMYFTRYSPEPLIATLNPAYDGPLKRIGTTNYNLQTVSENHVIHAVNKEGSTEISSITRANSTYPITLSFSPSFPDLTTLPDGTLFSGGFTILGHPSTGSISGTYVVERKNNKILVELAPSEGWKPRPNKLSLRLMYSAVKMFRTWPSEYRWHAEITEDEYGMLWMKSAWSK
jgi:hypothetical protein